MLRNWLNQSSLQTKFLMRFCVLLIIVLSSFFAYVQLFVIQPLKEDNENEKRQLALNISKQIDDYIYNQNLLSQRILANKQVFDILAAGHIPTTTEQGLRQSRTIKDAMFQAIGPTMNIREMIIYDVHGRQIAFFLGSPDNPYTLKPELKDRIDTKLYDERSYVLDIDAQGRVTFNRGLIDQDGIIYGYLTIELNASNLQSPTESATDGYVYILDENQQIIARNLHGQSLHTPPTFAPIEQPSGMYLDEAGDYVSYHQSENTGWTTYVITPRESVLGPVNSIMRLSLLIISGLVIILFVYTYWSTKNLLLPIRKLRNQISRIQYSNLSLQVDNPSHNNELVSLHEAFQELLSRLQQSIEREKLAVQEEAKARNSTLQAQIAPHFIHNVLYLISIAAQDKNYKAVTDMCKHLSENLRYIVSSSHHHVSLPEELDYTRHYLSLVQAHYEDDLEWEIIADEGAEQVQIPRLSIQPFVENCIEHAFNHIDPPWRLHVHFRIFRDVWAIEISDNGSGIEQSKLEEIKASIETASQAELGLHPDHGWGNMGIVNTVHRLQLMYQKRLFFNIFNNSKEEKGTTVQIIGSLTDDFY